MNRGWGWDVRLVILQGTALPIPSDLHGCGAAFILAGVRGEMTPSVILVAVGSAVSLAGVDVIYVSKGVIARIYLLDALVELDLMVWWLIELATSEVAQTQYLNYPLQRTRDR
jgi:hypothetical protein